MLVRHGQSSYNVERRVQGHCDESTLTEAGQKTARQVGEALRGLPFDAMYSSPLQRAKDTAELIRACLLAEHVPELQFTDNLKEINLVTWEGVLFSEVEATDPEGFQAWQRRPHELKMMVSNPDGTVTEYYPVPALYEQATQLWQDILPRHIGQTILLVAHSGINRALIGTAIGLTPADYQNVHQSNCGISVLNFPDDWSLADRNRSPVQVESTNQTAHLGKPLPEIRNHHRGPRFLLVRHGETDWNRDKRFQGQIDVPLNDRGREQSQLAAEFLQAIQMDFAFSSPMLRPKETAEIILQFHPGVRLELEDNLQEISHGHWEGKLEEEIRQEYPGILEQWQEAPATVQMPEGENLQDVWQRAIVGWQTILKSVWARAGDRPVTVLVVAHDAVNKALLCHLLNLGPEHFWNFKQGNGAVTVIDYPLGPEERAVLQAVNITSHQGSVLDRTAAGAL
ncbi:histidine phosphatase family protein [Leptolyngbya sp. 'hensonii']|uniref:histidine phosphatase family protein n=1 Tax=Leptolyngbya sp. 'hensonii' TaxID=1922337 RepID=UPI00341D1D0D